MSNSKLVNYTKISPNSTNPRNHKIDTIIIHHMAGKLSVEACGSVFADPARGASSNYGIDSDGRVGLYVEEKNRSWCTSNREVDHRGITIEVANSSTGGEWPVSDKAYAKLIDLCLDICQRNGIPKLNYTGDKTGNLMMHKWYANTQCPGPYLEKRFQDIADKVNARLGAEGTSEAPVESKPETSAANFPELSIGSKGEWVKVLQTLLAHHNCPCGKHGVDGDFGSATRDAAKKFQKENGLAADGIVGPKTWNKLLGIK